MISYFWTTERGTKRFGIGAEVRTDVKELFNQQPQEFYEQVIYWWCNNGIRASIWINWTKNGFQLNTPFFFLLYRSEKFTQNIVSQKPLLCRKGLFLDSFNFFFFFSVCKVKPKTFSIPLLNSVPLYLILDSVLFFGVFSEFPSFHDFHSSSRGEQTITKLHSQSFS